MNLHSCGNNVRAEKTIPYIGEKENNDFKKIFSDSLCFLRGIIDMKRESQFQSNLIKELKKIFPGCFVLKNDSSYCQGIPDLLVLYKDHWAMLECKRYSKATHRPNQDYYIKKFGEMSYASFVSPENKEEVLHELQQAFQS